MIDSEETSILFVNEEQRYAQHLITDPVNLSFDRHAYSRYKYGDTNQAKLFGQELASGFIEKHREFLLSSTQQFTAISSPRALIPPAAYYIFQTFIECVNYFLVSHSCLPVIEHTIQRLGTLAEDYSLLSPHERLDHLTHERYFLDSQPLTDKFLLFVDDIRITGDKRKITNISVVFISKMTHRFFLLFLGMHEMNIIRLLETLHIENPRLFIYYAELVNNHIPSTFEYQLNRCAIENLEQLLTIIHNQPSNFRINTRILKEILRSNLTELKQFLCSINYDLHREIYQACLACNYQAIEIFTKSLDYIHCYLKQRENNNNKQEFHLLK